MSDNPNGNQSDPEEIIRRTQRSIARLRESQQQLVRDIQHQYNALGEAVDQLARDQLRSYFNSSDSSGDEEGYTGIKDRNSMSSRGDRKNQEPTEHVPPEAVLYLQDRQYGFNKRSHKVQRHNDFTRHQLPAFISRHVPTILNEREIKLGTINKVFASQWLNDSQVVLGTKCNKLLVLDVRNNDLVKIPSLASSGENIVAPCPCGIHAISVNPSRNLLATGGQNTNDIAVYELPTFEPYCVGEGAHTDWIFDMEFIDDEHIITGSRDSTVAIWRLDKTKAKNVSKGSSEHEYPVIKPVKVKECDNALRVRALGLSRNKRSMGVLSMDAKFHFWDLEKFKQIDTIDLPSQRENVCVASSDDLGVFAIGSESYVTLLDHRKQGRRSTYRPKSLQIPPRGKRRPQDRVYSWPSKGIRSLSFNQQIISIGTGDGRLLFFDVRNSQFLQSEGQHHELLMGDGWLRNDANFRDHFFHGSYPSAIYTHCYDASQTRIFAAGGPLPAGLYGNYAGLFY